MKQFYLTFVTAVSILANASAYAAPAQDSAGEWKALGKGQYTDGWVTPGIYAPASYTDPSAYIFEVDVMESTATPGIYKIVSPYTSEAFPFLDKNTNTTPCDIIIDATNPDFVRIEPQNSGFVCSTITVNFTNPFFICNAGSYFEAEGNAEADIISFGYASTLRDGVIEIVNPRFGKSADVNAQGYEWQGGYNGRLVLPAGGEPAGSWNSLGECTYEDGFILAGWYMENPAEHVWNVPIEESVETPGLYRLIAPYTVAGNPMLNANTNTSNAYILVDATDPDNVLITPQYSGFTGYTGGSDKTYYIGNTTGSLIAEGLWTKEEIKQYLPNRLDKMADGIITITDPLFGYNATPDGFGYQWTGADDKPLGYPAKIYMPGAWSGIADIATDADAAPVYYNLQGVRVDNPAPGAVYIRRTGNKSKKIFIR